VVLTTHLCVLCGFQNKRHLWLNTTLTDWFLQPTWSVYCAVRTESLYKTYTLGLQRVKAQKLLNATPIFNIKKFWALPTECINVFCMSIGTKSSTLSLTSALHWDGWSTPHPGRYPLYRRLGGHQRRSGLIRKISPLLGLDSRTVQPVPSRVNPALRCSIRCMKYFVEHREMFPTKATDSNVP